MKIFKYFFEAIIIYTLFIIIKIIGLNLSRKLFSSLFEALGPFFKNDRIINENLKNFKHDIKKNERAKIKKKMWANYGMTFVEYIFLHKFRNNDSHIKINGSEILKKISNSNKPVIFVSGHFSNFELMSMEITKSKIKLATIYRPLNNIFLNPFMEYLRKKYICENQIKKGLNGVRESIDLLKKNVSIALMIDQRVSEGELIDFFNKPALTTTLPAQLSLKYNIPIVPVLIKRTSDKNFQIEILEEIECNKFENKIELTKELNRTLEKMIRLNPDQWIWTHNRWK